MNRPHHFYAYDNSEYEISKVIMNYAHLGKESLEMYKIEKIITIPFLLNPLSNYPEEPCFTEVTSLVCSNLSFNNNKLFMSCLILFF